MPLKTHRDEESSINLTPMIDIVFLLIIFFMVGTKFSELERKIALRLPEVSDNGALTDAPEGKVVNIYQDGRVTLNRKTVTLEELTNQLSAARSQYKDQGVQIRSDASANAQAIASVLTACRQAGVANFSFSVKLARSRK
jgi:biopolymer transport protein ExbD